jgi:hypothetical protein
LYNFRVKSAVLVTAAKFGGWKLSLNISSQEEELLWKYQTSVILKKREKELHFLDTTLHRMTKFVGLY